MVWLCIVAMGCTTRETDPYKVSTGDLLFGQNRLQSYIEQRKKENDDLRNRAMVIERRLNQQRAMLVEMERQVVEGRRALRIDEAAERELRIEIEGKKAELASLNDRLMRLKAEVKAADQVLESSNLGTEKQRSFDARINAQKREMSEIESKITFIKDVIERSVRTRINQRLKQGL